MAARGIARCRVGVGLGLSGAQARARLAGASRLLPAPKPICRGRSRRCGGAFEVEAEKAGE